MVASTQCHCQREVETVDHFLLRCSLWCEYRSEITGLDGETACTYREVGLDRQKMDCLKEGSQIQK